LASMRRGPRATPAAWPWLSKIKGGGGFGAWRRPNDDFLDSRLGDTTAGFDAKALIDRAAGLVGSKPTLLAADIPLSKSPITGRRVSDNAVSVAYGARYASTHTPSTTRPGPVSERIRLGFGQAGYELVTEAPFLSSSCLRSESGPSGRKVARRALKTQRLTSCSALRTVWSC
jgi:hypothetical protein